MVLRAIHLVRMIQQSLITFMYSMLWCANLLPFGHKMQTEMHSTAPAWLWERFRMLPDWLVTISRMIASGWRIVLVTLPYGLRMVSIWLDRSTYGPVGSSTCWLPMASHCVCLFIHDITVDLLSHLGSSLWSVIRLPSFSLLVLLCLIVVEWACFGKTAKFLKTVFTNLWHMSWVIKDFVSRPRCLSSISRQRSSKQFRRITLWPYKRRRVVASRWKFLISCLISWIRPQWK